MVGKFKIVPNGTMGSQLLPPLGRVLQQLVKLVGNEIAPAHHQHDRALEARQTREHAIGKRTLVGSSVTGSLFTASPLPLRTADQFQGCLLYTSRCV